MFKYPKIPKKVKKENSGMSVDNILKGIMKVPKKPKIDFDSPMKRKESIDIRIQAANDDYDKNKNKKVFEKVIEEMMLDDHFHAQYKPFIEEIRSVFKLKVEPYKKRFAILSILDTNRNLLKKAKIHTDSNISKMDHIKDVTKILRKYVKVTEGMKKDFGEVMTPLELIAEMLRTLPDGKNSKENVWSNPNLKWLDPCNGAGPFLSMVVFGLMQGLNNWEPDENKRYKHILENMVYSCEIQAKNMFLWMMTISPHGEHYLNIYTGSFLDEGFDKHAKKVWGIEKFDIILGNPPYQDNDENGRSKSGGNSLWSKFVSKSINILNDNKYLLFIHPCSWMSPSGNTAKDINVKINKYDILHLEVETAKKYFEGVGSNFTWYCLRKSNTPTHKTIIKTLFNKNIYEFEYCIKEYDYLPMFLSKEILSIQDKFKADSYFKFVIDYSFDQRKPFISKVKTTEYIYPLYHTVRQTFYASKKHPYQDNKKVLITKSGNLSPIYDKDGVYGTTETSAYHLVNDDIQGEFLLKLLNTKLYNFYLNVFKWSGFHNPIIIPNIDKDFSDEDLYNYFGLSEEEIQLIVKE